MTPIAVTVNKGISVVYPYQVSDTPWNVKFRGYSNTMLPWHKRIALS